MTVAGAAAVARGWPAAQEQQRDSLITPAARSLRAMRPPSGGGTTGPSSREGLKVWRRKGEAAALETNVGVEWAIGCDQSMAECSALPLHRPLAAPTRHIATARTECFAPARSLHPSLPPSLITSLKLQGSHIEVAMRTPARGFTASRPPHPRRLSPLPPPPFSSRRRPAAPVPPAGAARRAAESGGTTAARGSWRCGPT